jgi:hypothetical protein
MKTMIRFTARTASAIVLGMLLAAPAMAQDKAKAEDKAKASSDKKAPAKADAGIAPKVLLENEKVRATEVRYKPGEGGGMRERKPRLTRAMTDGSMERVYPDGKKEVTEWKAGQVRWFPKETFSNKNVGKNEVVLFVVEPK